MKKRNDEIVLTIGVPVYNVEDYVGDLLEELSRIDEPRIEVILINDGSNDRSLEICNEYRSERIRVYNQSNIGPSKTRNRIIDLSRGKWIMFVDSDDLINSKEYSNVLELLDDKVDLYISVADKLIYRKCLEKGSDALSMLVELEMINSPCDKIYRKDIIKKNGISFNPSFSIGEDLLFNIQYFKESSEVKFIDKQLNIIRYNPDSLTRCFRRGKYEELMNVNKLCCSYCLDDKRVLNSFIYIKVKNCFSCLKDYKKNKNRYEDEYFDKIKNTEIPNRLFLNNLKTTFVYWVWKLSPKKVLSRVLS